MLDEIIDKKRENIKSGMAVYRIDDEVSFTLCKVTGHCSKSIPPTEEEVKLSIKGYEENVGYLDCDIRESLAKCSQNGVHWRCSIHPESELVKNKKGYYCNICKSEHLRSKTTYEEFNFDEDEYRQIAKSIETGRFFSDLDICEVNKVFVTEKRKREKIDDDFDIDVSIKKDEHNKQVIQILIFDKRKTNGEHVQYVISPDGDKIEYDSTNLDPAKIVNKIKIWIRDNRTIKCDYESEVEDE